MCSLKVIFVLFVVVIALAYGRQAGLHSKNKFNLQKYIETPLVNTQSKTITYHYLDFYNSQITKCSQTSTQNPSGTKFVFDLLTSSAPGQTIGYADTVFNTYIPGNFTVDYTLYNFKATQLTLYYKTSPSVIYKVEIVPTLTSGTFSVTSSNSPTEASTATSDLTANYVNYFNTHSVEMGVLMNTKVANGTSGTAMSPTEKYFLSMACSFNP